LDDSPVNPSLIHGLLSPGPNGLAPERSRAYLGEKKFSQRKNAVMFYGYYLECLRENADQLIRVSLEDLRGI
jgi:hypothetical protein